jgi:hypothetical protein
MAPDAGNTLYCNAIDERSTFSCGDKEVDTSSNSPRALMCPFRARSYYGSVQFTTLRATPEP